MAKYFPNPSTAGCENSPNSRDERSGKTARKKNTRVKPVSLMLMRHHALPGDAKNNESAVRPDLRIYIRVQVQPEKESMFWFHKYFEDTITGKVLDLLASHLNIKSSKVPLRLYKLNESTIPVTREVLRNDLPICQQIEDGSLLAIVI
ncbi:hypothetical protein AX17_004372 [Amanita inopinata Kibby_2008]|nr:hypothetical protein AX17_004372 [Amanita inopinata Kibby_2008]